MGATQPFTATVTNSSNQAVSWTVNGIAGGDNTVGTISAAGLYTAPQILPATASVTVRATSQADATKGASATVMITSDVVVSVAPSTPSMLLGATQQFMASVTSAGNPNRNVTWSVSGPGCAGIACGIIDATGSYMGPLALPSPPTVTVTATSLADASKSASTAVALSSGNLIVTVLGPSSLDNGAQEQFNATVTPQAGSNTLASVNWSVSGAGCAGSACGVINNNTGVYSAPVIAPSPPAVTITATSVADPAKFDSLDVTINAVVRVFITPDSATVALERTQQFTASVGGIANQNVTWDVNGIIGGDATVGTVTQTGFYTAPVNMPPPRNVAVRATSQADPSQSATAPVTLFSQIVVLVVPDVTTRAVGRRETFCAYVTDGNGQTPGNPAVSWSVNGIASGNSTVGQIITPATGTCPPQFGTPTDRVDYTAPSSLPASNPVRVLATSQADDVVFGSAVVTIALTVSVSVSPSMATLPPGQTQPYSATVVGSPNQTVTWSLVGTACNGSPCGMISGAGVYTAAASVPPPPAPAPADTIVATSADGGEMGTATVTIANGPFIRTLLPSSIFSGPPNILTLRVVGVNFTSGNPSSQILFAGNALPTTCVTSTECTTTLVPSSLSPAGTRSVQIRNPDMTPSNQVSLVLVATTATEDVVSLTPGAPAAAGKDIEVVDPFNAGISSPPINLDSIGLLNGSNCQARGSSITVQRPASGSLAVQICIRGDGIATGHAYTLSGPNDIQLSNPVSLGLNFIQLTLTMSSTSQPGVRTLFVENQNHEKTAATGAIEVK